MRRFADGIVWLGIGVSLLGQAAFALFLGWMANESPTTVEPTKILAASGAVAIGFVVTGVGALYLGVRRVREARRT